MIPWPTTELIVSYTSLRDVYSLNVPVPSEVARLAGTLARELPRARERARDEHTLVLKRLGDEESFPAIQAQVREALRGQPTFDVQVTGI